MADEKLTREEQKLQTRQKILDTAIEMLLDPDFSSLNTNELAEKAEISKGSIFHHFGSKDELVLEAFEVIYIKQMVDFDLNDTDRSSKDLLHEFTLMNLEFIQSHANLNSLLLKYLSDLSSNKHQEVLARLLKDVAVEGVNAVSKLMSRLGWDNSIEETLGITRIYLAILDGIGIQIEMARNFPDNEFSNFELEPLVDLIVTLFTRSQQNETQPTPD